MTVQHILVPLDFSPYADRALEYAITLAQQLQARLTLLHVLHLTPREMGELTAAPSLEAYLQRVETDAQHQIQVARERVHQAGLPCDSVVVQGVPYQTIVELARSRAIDLIAMGTHGWTGLLHVLLGSVAERVVRLAPCPVLVTRGAPDTPAMSEDTTPAHP
jgi:nucleotide-binding universal stress UspA family protein